ncbi:ABC transporter permease [Collinsella sp. zg1085]|uniref:ABC transporter permease n=1 Tax=Collinsella sp. zg1085 TaxID=2844380 RepID=UPI001C0E2E51|nr:ABC transporter permease [Collinsella sp. zg1085]QWT17564.1 ABC transporter permease [Collinsella sp. zg1085]
MVPTNQNTILSHHENDWRKDVYILKQLVGKDFKLKYRRSFLGVLWSVLNPLLMMVVMSAVFSTFFSGLRGANIVNYPLYLILGNITFGLMNDATSSSLTSIIGSSSLLKKVKIHRLVFPVQKVLFALVNFFFSLIAVAIVMLWFRIIPTWHIAWLPVGLFLLMLFCMGVGLALSALSVFFRDVIHLWGVIMTAWTYATPLFWDFAMINDMGPKMQLILKANPMYAFVMFMRDIFLYQTNPSMAVLASCTAWAALAMIVGYVIFHKTEHKFILYI